MFSIFKATQDDGEVWILIKLSNSDPAVGHKAGLLMSELVSILYSWCIKTNRRNQDAP